MIERVVLARQVGYQNVRTAIVIVIAKIDAHARDPLAIVSQRDPRLQSALGEGAIAVVVKQKLLHAVIGHEDIGKPIAIVVGEGHAERFPLPGRYAGAQTDILESSVTAIMVQNAGGSGKFRGRAIDSGRCAAELVVAQVPFQVPRDKQVQLAIVIVVHEAG